VGQDPNDLGLALWAHAARTAGTKGAEFLAQAVAAFHSCLESGFEAED
jgi:hypothetical protein